MWLEDVVEKLYHKHRVTQTEVEEVIEGRPKFRKMKKGRFAGEDVYLAAGQTHGGDIWSSSSFGRQQATRSS